MEVSGSSFLYSSSHTLSLVSEGYQRASAVYHQLSGFFSAVLLWRVATEGLLKAWQAGGDIEFFHWTALFWMSRRQNNEIIQILWREGEVYITVVYMIKEMLSLVHFV